MTTTSDWTTLTANPSPPPRKENATLKLPAKFSHSIQLSSQMLAPASLQQHQPLLKHNLLHPLFPLLQQYALILSLQAGLANTLTNQWYRQHCPQSLILALQRRTSF